jgi:hypothetical protein
MDPLKVEGCGERFERWLRAHRVSPRDARALAERCDSELCESAGIGARMAWFEKIILPELSERLGGRDAALTLALGEVEEGWACGISAPQARPLGAGDLWGSSGTGTAVLSARPIDYGPLSEVADIALRRLDRTPLLRFVVLWLGGLLLFGVLFYFTR